MFCPKLLVTIRKKATAGKRYFIFAKIIEVAYKNLAEIGLAKCFDVFILRHVKKITVLGSGMVGRTIAQDLSKNYLISVADLHQVNLDLLRTDVEKIQVDLSVAENIKDVIRESDLVIGAVPGFMGYKTLQTVIESRKDIVDISFFAEDALQLNELAKSNNVTAVVDCGVAPGMDNILLGYHYHRMKVEAFTCMVGGLPRKPELPFQYKAPFSPIDVLEEYTRPARLIENRSIVTKPALSEPRFYEFENVGTLEAFNTDGLRSLLFTMPVNEMKEITLRYPGHRQLMEDFSKMGFFSTNPIVINGQEIIPIEFTAKMFFPKWKYEEGEEDLTVMRIIISGTENSQPKTYTYDLYDVYDKKTNTRSMSRTTGYTCTAVATMMLENNFHEKGIVVPEYLGRDERNVNFILDFLKQRNVEYKLTVG
jgi:lysine 6-dehydrogenase